MIPDFIYGTAWKEEKTETLVWDALNAGFTAIDTANQRKHYFEEAVGKGITKFLETGKKREDLWIQTKFTYLRGQDQRLPYDPEASFSEQVKQSFESSLKHLNTDYLDSYLLHGPYSGQGITDIDWEVWATMSEFQALGKTKAIGVSNVQFAQLKELYSHAKVKPSFVQNRCYARTGWDHPVREFCREHEIAYQGFSLLTANAHELRVPKIQAIADHYSKTIPQILFRFSQQIGMIPLTGTTNTQHMSEDLTIHDFELKGSELEVIESIAI